MKPVGPLSFRSTPPAKWHLSTPQNAPESEEQVGMATVRPKNIPTVLKHHQQSQRGSEGQSHQPAGEDWTNTPNSPHLEANCSTSRGVLGQAGGGASVAEVQSSAPRPAWTGRCAATPGITTEPGSKGAIRRLIPVWSQRQALPVHL